MANEIPVPVWLWIIGIILILVGWFVPPVWGLIILGGLSMGFGALLSLLGNE